MIDDRKSDEEETDSINRRTYLAGASVALGSLGILQGASRSARAEEYETIKVPAGEMYSYSIDDGETWENKLIDITAEGANAHIDATASGFTIRNIGFKGEGTRNANSNYHIGLAERGGGTSVVENVYMGDGDDGSSHKDGFAAVFVYPSHSGVVEFRNVNIQNFTDNGMYASDPGHTAVSSSGGEVHVYNSFAGNCTAANFRFGTDGSKLVNSCSWGGPHRGVWPYFENVDIIDSHIGGMDNPDRAIHVGGGAYDKMSRASATIENSYFEGHTLHTPTNELHGSSEGEPEFFMPDGCPTSAEEAAAGNGSNGTSGSNGNSLDEENDTSESSHLLAFVTSPDAYNDTYSFVAAGDVEKATADYDTPSGNSIGANGNDTIDVADGTTTVEGLTGNGYGDAYRVHGPVTSITIDNPDAMWVELDGEAMSTDEVIDVTAESSGDGSALENRILINGVGTTGESRYEFDVTGEIERSTYQGASIDGDMTIEDGHVSGAVTGWRDAFAYSGDLENVSLEGDARVEVNGEQIDTDDYGDALPRVLTIVGNGSRATYQVSVDGIIEPVVWDEADDSVTVDSGQAEGSIERGVQRFGFSGSVTDLTFTEGTAHVYADRDRIVPDDFSG